MITAMVGGIFLLSALATIYYYNSLSSNNPTTAPTPDSTPTSTPEPTATITPTPQPTATPNSRLSITYFEQSRNQTMIVIEFKFEPNSYIFQWNASSFYLIDGPERISANINDVVISGTQYSTLFFPINNYQGTDYHLSSDKLPTDTILIKK